MELEARQMYRQKQRLWSRLLSSPFVMSVHCSDLNAGIRLNTILFFSLNSSALVNVDADVEWASVV